MVHIKKKKKNSKEKKKERERERNYLPPSPILFPEGEKLRATIKPASGPACLPAPEPTHGQRGSWHQMTTRLHDPELL